MKYCTLFLLLFLLSSCKKDKELPDDDNPPVFSEPVVRPKGEPLGDRLTSTIGTQGGTIKYGDLIQIDVPAGAVENPTLFGIQPISNTLDSSSSTMAFRLFPENVTFKKAVNITFFQQQENGEVPTSRMISFQRSDGVWCGVASSLDATTKSVTTSSTHFSDWVWLDMITLRKDRESVGSGGIVNLKLREQILGALSSGNQIDSVPLAALEDIGRSKDIIVKNWKIITGPGSIEPKINSNFVMGDAIYKAPANISTQETVEIQVEVESRNGYVSDPKVPGGRRKFGKMILLTQIGLEAETYIHVKVGGQSHDLSAHMYGGIINNVIQLGNVNLNGGIQLSMSCFGSLAGNYPGGKEAGQSIVGFSFPASPFKQNFYNVYFDCTGVYKSSGNTKVTITEEHIIGTFTGTIYINDSKPCGFTESKAVEIDFKIRNNR